MNGVLLTCPFGGLTGEALLRQAYDSETRAALKSLVSLLPPVTEQAELELRIGELNQVDFLFSTWGMPALTANDSMRYFPKLKAIFYAAGTVRSFARPFLERGVRIFSAAAVNAVPVAEYVAAQIVLANKGFYQSALRYRAAGWANARNYYEAMPGNYESSVGILGAGAIGQRVIGLLRAYRLRILVFDPFLSDAMAEEMGVEKADLETIFVRCGVVSNHLADNEQTKGLLDYRLFSQLSDKGVFLNTGRGAQVVEADLARALSEAPNRTAILDVTVDEPIRASHLFWHLSNVVLTPHIAGSAAGEIPRLGYAMREACDAYIAGGQPKGEVTLTMLETMA